MKGHIDKTHLQGPYTHFIVPLKDFKVYVNIFQYWKQYCKHLYFDIIQIHAHSKRQFTLFICKTVHQIKKSASLNWIPGPKLRLQVTGEDYVVTLTQ